MPNISYTIYRDPEMTKVKLVARLIRGDAERVLAAFRHAGRCEPYVGQIVAGCRIDHIGDDDDLEVHP